MGARTGVGALGLVLLAILVFLAVSSWSRQPAVAKPSIQPITFPHSLHVQTYKVDCQTCHGPVEAMTTFGAVTGPRLTNDLLNLVGLRPAAPPLTMGWCLDCHRRQNATADAHAPLDCVTCHH